MHALGPGSVLGTREGTSHWSYFLLHAILIMMLLIGIIRYNWFINVL